MNIHRDLGYFASSWCKKKISLWKNKSENVAPHSELLQEALKGKLTPNPVKAKDGKHLLELEI